MISLRSCCPGRLNPQHVVGLDRAAGARFFDLRPGSSASAECGWSTRTRPHERKSPATEPNRGMPPRDAGYFLIGHQRPAPPPRAVSSSLRRPRQRRQRLAGEGRAAATALRTIQKRPVSRRASTSSQGRAISKRGSLFASSPVERGSPASSARQRRGRSPAAGRKANNLAPGFHRAMPMRYRMNHRLEAVAAEVNGAQEVEGESVR